MTTKPPQPGLDHPVASSCYSSDIAMTIARYRGSARKIDIHQGTLRHLQFRSSRRGAIGRV